MKPKYNIYRHWNGTEQKFYFTIHYSNWFLRFFEERPTYTKFDTEKEALDVLKYIIKEQNNKNKKLISQYDESGKLIDTKEHR